MNIPLIVLSVGGVQNTSNYYENTRNYQLYWEGESERINRRENKRLKFKKKLKLFWIVSVCGWTPIVFEYTAKWLFIFNGGSLWVYIQNTISLNSLKTIDWNQSIWLIVCINEMMLFCCQCEILFPHSEFCFPKICAVLVKIARMEWNGTERNGCVCVWLKFVMYDYKNCCEMDWYGRWKAQRSTWHEFKLFVQVHGVAQI